MSRPTLMPLLEVVARHVFAAERIHADDTTVTTHPSAAAPPAAVYYYSPDRGTEHPSAIFRL